jgi:hypothetical protein
VTVLLVIGVLATWLLLSAVTTVACAALVRGGAREERRPAAVHKAHLP